MWENLQDKGEVKQSQVQKVSFSIFLRLCLIFYLFRDNKDKQQNDEKPLVNFTYCEQLDKNLFTCPVCHKELNKNVKVRYFW